MTMDCDLVDALTMVPGIVMAHGFAWSSDDFVYKVALLSWVWVCACSMVYHLNWCERKLRRYDLRAQWVAQVFMTLGTPQSSWPVVVGGLIPTRRMGRVVLNGIGAVYFLWHSMAGQAWLLSSYFFYFGQFLFDKPWMHSAFHMCLHCAGGCAALKPTYKYHVPISGKWAYVVEFVGLMILLPKRGAWKAIRNLANLWDRRQNGKNQALSDSKKPDEISVPAPIPTTTAAAAICSEEASA